MYLLLITSHICYLIKYLVVFMTVVHTYFYIVVDKQRGCHTLKFVEKFKTHILCSVKKFFPTENCAVYEIMWKTW